MNRTPPIVRRATAMRDGAAARLRLPSRTVTSAAPRTVWQLQLKRFSCHLDSGTYCTKLASMSSRVAERQRRTWGCIGDVERKKEGVPWSTRLLQRRTAIARSRVLL